jgi:lysophospholipase L1-like esterase
MTSPQTTQTGATAPPQLDALGPDTDLVTVTIGANDVGLVELALSCIRVLPPPLGVPGLPVVGTLPVVGASCAEAATTGGVDTYAEKIKAVEPTIGVMLAEIHSRAPKAHVFVVGYGTYLRPGGCWPLWPQDADYLQANVNRLDDAMARQATAHGATFVDVRPASVGHDICAEETARYYEPYLPDASSDGAVLLHPKPLGMSAIAGVVENAARAGRPND